MASKSASKVTSVGSHSGGPSAPNATPVTDTGSSGSVDPPPSTDFAAVANALVPISETLNDSAHEAMYPSPPINTPVIGSPTPSGNVRFPLRGRGFSLIGDSLAKLKLDRRKLSRRHQDADVTSSTGCSNVEACGECNCDVASMSEGMSEAGKAKNCAEIASTLAISSKSAPQTLDAGSVRIGLGSPAINPRIEEYLTFSSKDLPTQAPAPTKPTTLAEHASKTSTAALRAKSLQSFNSDGVTEKSIWVEEVEELVDRACLRLEQLAKDEHNADPSKSVKEYYISRLSEFLGDRRRIAPAKVELAQDLQMDS